MKIGADTVMISSSFELVVSVVAVALFRNSPEWLDVLAEASEARMVFVAHDFAEIFGVDDDVANEAILARDGVEIENAYTFNFVAFGCLEIFAE